MPETRDPNPIEFEDLYTSIVLGGYTSPGQCKLSGHDRKINWDVKAGSGQSGASTTLKDIPLIEFTVTLFLADKDDFDAWPFFRDLLLSTVNGPKPKALDVYHPDLATNEINSVVLSSIGGVVHDGKGGQTITVKLQEYKPPKPKGGSPTGSKAAAKADPNAAANAELAALTKTFEASPWG